MCIQIQIININVNLFNLNWKIKKNEYAEICGPEQKAQNYLISSSIEQTR